MTTKLSFTKMHAFGNDFAVFDFRVNNTDFVFDANNIILTADRNFGIGCDQLLALYKSPTPDDAKGVNVVMKVYNTDGTEAQNCGNGVRCITGYIARETEKPIIRVQIGQKIMLGKANKQTEFAKVNMGVPVVNGDTVEIGNKHKVVIVKDFNSMSRTADKEFNVNYAQVRSRGEVFVRTVERGAGETMSCGSGACAVAAYCISNNLVDKNVKIVSRGSDIMDAATEISWDGAGKPMLEGGNYTFVFTGEIEL